ncbi:site-specific DNA-methyltransferase [Deinococcus sp. SL84]|uniref:site-specific DNA-methyltransferase n=1 Tax=Deinococcus sp. SL84 TaxID=2994663 RepID=UPI0022722FBA|nr:site-specific DNA-methyltransferase [Deinococcus sp. SL84]MCY1703615.1 site-specific DNA-methyltransferase [Deinococcus sp. SL84]
MKNLYFGDNLQVLRDEILSSSVDLIYLDPPFNSQVDYNVIFKDHQGAQSGAQILAFEDTWKWGAESEQAIEDLMSHWGHLADFLQRMVDFLGKNSLSAYLVMMAVRLVEMHRVLKPTGTLYLHCDPAASHYLKIVLDIIFGASNFRNEIIWQRTNAKSLQTRRLPTNHDIIFRYTKSDQFTWNADEAFVPYDLNNLSEATLRAYSHQDDDGRRYTLGDLLNPNKDRPNLDYEFLGVHRVWRWTKERMQAAYEAGLVVQSAPGTVPRIKRYLDEQRGIPLGDVWTDILPLSSHARERLGYPTQKPVALLERIIRVSSNPSDVVLDPFCGCGTTISAAENLGRQWIGIDVTHLSVSLIKARLKRDFDLIVGKDYLEHGTPRDAQAAQYFAEADPFQFQFWIVGEIGAQPYGAVGDSKKGKKGGDTGIDGQMYFRTPDGGKIERVIVSVKAGKNLNPAMVRELRGTVEREKAAIGVLLLAYPPTKGMRDEVAKAGAYTWGGKVYPKLQMLTVEQLLQGEQPQIPRGAVNVSYEQKEAKSLRGKKAKPQGAMPLFD